MNPSEAINLKMKSQRTGRDVHRLDRIEVQLPGQIENLSQPLTGALPKNERKARQPNNSDSNDSDKKSEETEQKHLHAEIMNLLSFFGLPIGVRFAYDWKPQQYFMFFGMLCAFFFTGFSIFYTVYVHFVNGSYIRILEPLAISGLYMSVMQNLINEYKIKIKIKFF